MSFSKPHAARLIRHVLSLAKVRPQFSEVSIVFVDDKTIRRWNRQFRHRDKPTDVLSFDYGEIIVAVPTARRQAREHAISLKAELDLLVVHGLLHILGFDHHTTPEKRRMAALEKKVLGTSGLIMTPRAAIRRRALGRSKKKT